MKIDAAAKAHCSFRTWPRYLRGGEKRDGMAVRPRSSSRYLGTAVFGSSSSWYSSASQPR